MGPPRTRSAPPELAEQQQFLLKQQQQFELQQKQQQQQQAAAGQQQPRAFTGQQQPSISSPPQSNQNQQYNAGGSIPQQGFQLPSHMMNQALAQAQQYWQPQYVPFLFILEEDMDS